MILKDFGATKKQIRILWKRAKVFSINKWGVISDLLDYLMTKNCPFRRDDLQKLFSRHLSVLRMADLGVIQLAIPQKCFGEFSISFRIFLWNIFLHTLLSFGVSRLYISFTNAQTVTKWGGYQTNLLIPGVQIKTEPNKNGL